MLRQWLTDESVTVSHVATSEMNVTLVIEWWECYRKPRAHVWDECYVSDWVMRVLPYSMWPRLRWMLCQWLTDESVTISHLATSEMNVTSVIDWWECYRKPRGHVWDECYVSDWVMRVLPYSMWPRLRWMLRLWLSDESVTVSHVATSEMNVTSVIDWWECYRKPRVHVWDECYVSDWVMRVLPYSMWPRLRWMLRLWLSDESVTVSHVATSEMNVTLVIEWWECYRIPFGHVWDECYVCDWVMRMLP